MPCVSRLAAAILVFVANEFVSAAVAQSAAAPAREPGGSLIFDDASGFRWGSSGNNFVMARTKDGGRSWTALSLDGVSIAMADLSIGPNGQASPVSVHFEDSAHGWIAWATESSTLQIAVTTDAGASWRPALNYSTDTVIDRELYRGDGRAWLLAEMPEGMTRVTKLLLATGDGGASWNATTFEQGGSVTGWSFLTSSLGFLSVAYPAGISILFYRTADGGKTWSPVALALPPGIDATEVDDTDPGVPVFPGSDLSRGRLKVKLNLPGGPIEVGYRSADGGQTWSLADSGEWGTSP